MPKVEDAREFQNRPFHILQSLEQLYIDRWSGRNNDYYLGRGVRVGTVLGLGVLRTKRKL